MAIKTLRLCDNCNRNAVAIGKPCAMCNHDLCQYCTSTELIFTVGSVSCSFQFKLPTCIQCAKILQGNKLTTLSANSDMQTALDCWKEKYIALVQANFAEQLLKPTQPDF
jgi:hypothetical protein